MSGGTDLDRLKAKSGYFSGALDSANCFSEVATRVFHLDTAPESLINETALLAVIHRVTKDEDIVYDIAKDSLGMGDERIGLFHLIAAADR